VAVRASIVGAAETDVGKVRDHNEDSHFIDPEGGILVVCDGMGGHAAGEVASAIAVKTVREHWTSRGMHTVVARWLKSGTPEAHKELLATITEGVIAAHNAIIAEAKSDRSKSGMGTTIVAGMIVGGEMVFAHCGDSRAYLVRDGIAMQLTEDHTLLARLLAAGIDVDTEGEGSRFKSMLTNALGIGHECKASTFVVPLADGDRFLLCSDGITEYVKEHEVGDVLAKSSSPGRAARTLVKMALERGGADNATALVVRVLEAGESSRPAEQLRRDRQAIDSCPLWAKTSPQQRLRALRIGLPRDHAPNTKLPAHTLGDRVAWIVIEGELMQDGARRGPGSLLYPESLLTDRPLTDKDSLAVAKSEVRTLALRADDFRELCDDDPELAEHLLAAIADEIAKRAPAKPADARRAPTAQPVAADRSRRDMAAAHAATEPPPVEGELPRLNVEGPPARPQTLPPPLPSIPRPPSSPNAARAKSRASLPPSDKSLIAPPGETEAALDAAMEKLTVDRDWAKLATAGDDAPARAIPPVARPPSQPGVEIIVEAEAPPPREVPAVSDASEPEIQITTLSDDDAPEIEMFVESESEPVAATPVAKRRPT
jgi:serine/threonine protein phosphatase PrpC